MRFVPSSTVTLAPNSSKISAALRLDNPAPMIMTSLFASALTRLVISTVEAAAVTASAVRRVIVDGFMVISLDGS